MNKKLIKSTELRIGNLILYRHKPAKVTKRLLSLIDASEDYAGIPIDDSWLEKLGFETAWGSSKQIWDIRMLTERMYLRPAYGGGYLWGWYSTHDSIQALHIEQDNVQPIHYVHQLQNLYYSLTFEELMIDGHVELKQEIPVKFYDVAQYYLGVVMRGVGFSVEGKEIVMIGYNQYSNDFLGKVVKSWAWYHLYDFRPLLKRLSGDIPDCPSGFVRATKEGYDLFGLIDSGEAIEIQ
jgi:hypothetical protein